MDTTQATGRFHDCDGCGRYAAGADETLCAACKGRVLASKAAQTLYKGADATTVRLFCAVMALAAVHASATVRAHAARIAAVETWEETAAATIARLVEILWPNGNADAEHDSDTLGEVARLMDAYRPSGAAEYVVAEGDADPDDIADLADGVHEFAAVADASGPVRNAAIDALQANPDAVAVKVEGGKVVALVGPNGSEVTL